MRAARQLFYLFTAQAFLLTSLAATTAWAQEEAPEAEAAEQTDFADTIHVIQPKPVLQKGRFNLSPRLGMTVNDAVYRNFMLGASASFHLSERLYLGALFQWFNFGDIIGGPTQIYRDVNTETQSLVDAPYLNWAGGAELGFVPLFGKFALFNRGLIFYDLSLSAGAVYSNAASVSNPTANEANVGGTVSLTSRFFLNEWMAFNVEVRDVIYMARLRGASSTVLSHSVTLGLGMSFYFPMSFEYSENRER